MPTRTAITALTRCAVQTNRLMARGVLRRPSTHVGRRLRFADGSTASVYRETRITGPDPSEPAVLVVGFTLRVVHSGWAHAIFRAESLLNTVLFAGFPGFESKLWLRHDERGRYRGLYEWDGPDRAEYYVAALRYVLGPVSRTGSIAAVVVPGLRRDELLRRPEHVTYGAREWSQAWWRVIDVRPPWP